MLSATCAVENVTKPTQGLSLFYTPFDRDRIKTLIANDGWA